MIIGACNIHNGAGWLFHSQRQLWGRSSSMWFLVLRKMTAYSFRVNLIEKVFDIFGQKWVYRSVMSGEKVGHNTSRLPLC